MSSQTEGLTSLLRPENCAARSCCLRGEDKIGLTSEPAPRLQGRHHEPHFLSQYSQTKWIVEGLELAGVLVEDLDKVSVQTSRGSWPPPQRQLQKNVFDPQLQTRFVAG